MTRLLNSDTVRHRYLLRWNVAELKTVVAPGLEFALTPHQPQTLVEGVVRGLKAESCRGSDYYSPRLFTYESFLFDAKLVASSYTGDSSLHLR